MSLIQQVKRTKTRGSQVYGVVELSMLGRATVILKGSSQRLTNLPVYGENVATGDEVIVDYSAEGQPYVRMAIPRADLTKPATNVIDNTAPTQDDGFFAGKVTLTTDMTFEDTIAGSTLTWTPILFDLVLYDTGDLWGDGRFGALPTGQYLVDVNLGFTTDAFTASGWCAVQLLNYEASSGSIAPVDFKIPYSKDVRFYGGSDHNIHVVNFSTLCRISENDEGIGLAFAVYTSEYIYPEVLQQYSWLSVHKLKNLSGDNEQAIRGYWDSAEAYFI